MAVLDRWPRTTSTNLQQFHFRWRDVRRLRNLQVGLSTCWLLRFNARTLFSSKKLSLRLDPCDWHFGLALDCCVGCHEVAAALDALVAGWPLRLVLLQLFWVRLNG